MGKFKKMMEVTSNASYIGDEGEPDTGFIKGNKKRILNRHRGSKPENWYERGGYTQVDFPKADYIYGKGEDEEYSVKKKAYVAKIDKQFEAEFEKWEDWTIDKTIKESGYKKVMNNILLERVDYYEIAFQLVKKYKLDSKIKMGSGKNFGEYIPEKDIITLRPSYKTYKEFLLTILHEIKHALDAKRLGKRKFMKKYTQAGTMAQYQGLDPHDDNRWEESAEKWARKELKKYLYKR